jgi:mannose-6-phosphate isomerase-like protein (cupin superfamily)
VQPNEKRQEESTKVKIRNLHAVPGKPVHGGTVMQWELIEENEFKSTINVFHFNVIDPGVALEPHQHEMEEQIFFVLGGKGIVKVGKEQHSVEEGDAIYLPPRLDHSLKNTGTHPLRFSAIGAKITGVK